MHLFAGAGGGILGEILTGYRCVCAVEIDSYCQKILLARQRDGILPRFPIWDNVTTFDGIPWRGSIDIIAGGFPCTDISVAGKHRGIDGGGQSGLWMEMARVIREVRPRFVFVENSPNLVTRDLGRVLGDLAEMGYDAEFGVLGADDVGAPHMRKRIWIVGSDATCQREWEVPARSRTEGVGETNPDGMGGNVPNTDSERRGEESECECRFKDTSESGNDGGAEYVADSKSQCERESADQTNTKSDKWQAWNESGICSWWKTEPGVGRVVDGMGHRLDRLKAIGNGQVPRVAEIAWEVLVNRLNK